jgi:hypothetical protein
MIPDIHGNTALHVAAMTRPSASEASSTLLEALQCPLSVESLFFAALRASYGRRVLPGPSVSVWTVKSAVTLAKNSLGHSVIDLLQTDLGSAEDRSGSRACQRGMLQLACSCDAIDACLTAGLRSQHGPPSGTSELLSIVSSWEMRQTGLIQMSDATRSQIVSEFTSNVLAIPEAALPSNHSVLWRRCSLRAAAPPLSLPLVFISPVVPRA